MSIGNVSLADSGRKKGSFLTHRICILLILASTVFSLRSAHAQMAIYAQASGGNLQFANTSRLYGATFGGYYTKRVGVFSVGPDFRGAILRRGAQLGAYSDQVLEDGQFGLRAGASPFRIPVMPYAEATFGLAYWRGGLTTARQDSFHGLVQIIGGVDYSIVPRIDWRVVEFTYGRAGATPGTINPETLSTGVVVHLP